MIFTRDHRIPGLALTEFPYRLMPTGLQIQSGISCFCKVEAERLDCLGGPNSYVTPQSHVVLSIHYGPNVFF